MDLIAKAVEVVHIGEPVTFEGLTMWPLVGEDEADAEYYTLDEALDQDWIRVTEVSEQGSVPDLMVANKAPRPVLLTDGEELVGAKQNRVINLTILVPAEQSTRIPVSCVEAGRWARRSHAFAASSRMHYASGRARKTAQVSQSMRALGEHRSDQTDVWQDIAAKALRLGAPSATGAMATMFEAHRESLETWVRAFGPVDSQRGAVFVVDGGVIGLDLFDRAWTFMALRAKLVRSYALDALDRDAGTVPPCVPRGHAPAAPETVRPFLAAVAAAHAEEFAAVGAGRDVRLTGRGVSGAALLAGRRVVHLNAFGAAADFR
jgi:hypothetical protein